MKPFLFMLIMFSGTLHAQFPPELFQQYINQKSDDPLVMELQFKGASAEGIFDAMVLRERGRLSHDEIVNTALKQDADRLRRRRNAEQLPHVQEASYLICDTKIIAINSAIEKRRKNEAVDIYKTIVKPNLGDPMSLRLCLMSKVHVFQLLEETNPDREAMRTVLRDVYMELEKVADDTENNPAYLNYKKPFRSAKSGSVSR